MKNHQIEYSKAFILVKIIDYVPNSVVIKSIIKKPTGYIKAISVDVAESLTGKVSPFDTFIQVIDGEAEIVIDDKPNMLNAGQAIIIPAHTRNAIRANERFKMVSTIIKSGYEEMSI